MRECVAPPRPERRRHVGRRRRPHRPRPPPAVDHRSRRRRRISRWPTRTARCGSSSTARSTTTPSCGASCRKSGRHRWRTDHSDTEVILHGFEEWGIDVLATPARHVRVRVVGRAERGVVAGARSHRRQAALLQHRRRSRDVCVGDQGAACGTRAAPGRPRRGAVSLPVVPDDARHTDAVRRHSEAGAGNLDAHRQRWADPPAALLGRLGRTRSRSTGASDEELGERILAEAARIGAAAKGERRSRRRVSVGRRRLEHQRRAVCRGRIAARAHVLDWLRPRLLRLCERAASCARDGRAHRRRTSRAPPDQR